MFFYVLLLTLEKSLRFCNGLPAKRILLILILFAEYTTSRISFFKSFCCLYFSITKIYDPY